MQNIGFITDEGSATVALISRCQWMVRILHCDINDENISSSGILLTKCQKIAWKNELFLPKAGKITLVTVSLEVL